MQRRPSTQIAIVSITFLAAGWFLLALVHGFAGAVVVMAAPLLLFGLLARLGILRPWTDILAWGSTATFLVLAGWPPETGIGQILVIMLALFLLVMGLHAPSREPDARGLGVQAAWWGAAVIIVGLLAWWPVIALEGRTIGVLDPSTSVGIAVRLVSVLAMLGLLVLGLSGLRSRGARKLENDPAPE